MTQKNSWMPRLDIIFVFSTVFVIAMSSVPGPIPLQIVEVSTKSAGVQSQTYCLAVNDPRLRKLDRRIEGYGKTKPAALIGKARWQTETATLYATRTMEEQVKAIAQAGDARETAQVMTVSYLSPSDSATATPKQLDLVKYWNEFGAKSEHLIGEIEDAWEARRATLGPPPVKFGGTRPGVIQGGTIYVASMLAIFATVVMTCWRASFPTRRMNVVAGTNEQQSESSDLAIELPAGSVKLHQPMMVHLRRLAYVGLLVTAVISVL